MHADSRQVQPGSLASLAGSPDRPPLTSAAPPGGRRWPQQRAVNLLQPLQVSHPARAGLTSRLFHGCYHGVEVAFQGATGAGLSGRGVEPGSRPSIHPPQLQRQVRRCMGNPTWHLPSPQEAGHSFPAKAFAPHTQGAAPAPPQRLPEVACSCGSTLPLHHGVGRHLVPGNVGNPDGQDGLQRLPCLKCHQALGLTFCPHQDVNSRKVVFCLFYL